MCKKESVSVSPETQSNPSGSEIAGSVNAAENAAAGQSQMDKFQAEQGHGYAAEQANNLYDLLHGRDAVIVGGDNAKDGADRKVDGTLIQTKYCHNASASVQAAFRNGQYRYLAPNGTPMQLEVPSDQYEDAVRLMQKRIEAGQVPGVTDPNDAKSLIRRGSFTYQQAVNLTKFGTIESLTYDATNGTIVAANAFGITAALTFAQHLWRGDPPEVAIEYAAYSGLKIGGAAFINTVVTNQLMRTALPKALVVPTDTVVKLLGPKASAVIANSLRSGANIYGAAAMNNVSKLLRGNAITGVVMLVVLSASDIRNCFEGRISGKQLFKNVVTLAGSMAAGCIAGGLVLTVLTGGVGIAVSIAVSVAAGTAGGQVVNHVVGTFIEDDAVELCKIIEESFCQQVGDYLLSTEELDILLTRLNQSLEQETLLQMYASPDHRAFADELIQQQIEKLLRMRCQICLPSEADFIQGIGRVFADAETGKGIFAQNADQPDAVTVGRALTGKTMSPLAAKTGLYASRQMNLAQMQGENRLRQMAQEEKRYQAKQDALHSERTALKNELSELLGGSLA